MNWSIRYSPLAVDDLDSIFAWLAERAGDDTAEHYVDRVERRINQLVDFPKRGRARNDVGRGIRSWTFERRLVILYRVNEPFVDVLRVVAGARDLSSLRF